MLLPQLLRSPSLVPHSDQHLGASDDWEATAEVAPGQAQVCVHTAIKRRDGQAGPEQAIMKNNVPPESQSDCHVEERSHSLCKVEGGCVSPARHRLERDVLEAFSNNSTHKFAMTQCAKL